MVQRILNIITSVCVLTGRAQEVYSALTIEQSGDYEIAKTALLQEYELAPEA